MIFDANLETLFSTHIFLSFWDRDNVLREFSPLVPLIEEGIQPEKIQFAISQKETAERAAGPGLV